MLSPFVRKVRVMLALKKIDYDIDVQVSPLSVPEEMSHNTNIGNRHPIPN